MTDTTRSAREILPHLLAATPYIPEIHDDPDPQTSSPICTEAEARAAGLDTAPSLPELTAMAETIVAAAQGAPGPEVDLARAVPLMAAEVERLRARVAELEPYAALTPQRCEKGVHPDWLADSEHAHACPWCRVAELEQQTTTVRAETLREAADHAEKLRQFDAVGSVRKAAQVSENVGVLRVADGLRRLAAEAGEPGDVDEMAASLARDGFGPDEITDMRNRAASEPTGFFQPSRTYTREHHGHTIQFRVEHVATPPGGTRPIAFGWRTEPCLSGWAPEDSDDMDGWTEATEGGAR